MIYIIGINGFIGKNIYLHLKRYGITVTCLSHGNVELLRNIIDECDIVINCCGVNRANTYEDYLEGNVEFTRKLIDITDKKPFIIHLSSSMTNGFVNETNNKYQEYFIKTKILADNLLIDKYPKDKLCIIKPSNIYGYNCEPYKNNILVTLVYEKIIKDYKTININRNCIRNFLSIEGLCSEIFKIINTKTTGVYNILSNNNVDLEFVLNCIYDGVIPSEINILDNEYNCFNNSGNSITIQEDINTNIKDLENNIRNYNDIQNFIFIKPISKLVQERGEMIEISNLNSNRLYMISINYNCQRGNHYHLKQIEHFYTLKGRVIYLLYHKDFKDIILFKILDSNSLLIVKPLIIHTLLNDFLSNNCEILIASTQEYIENKVPDTIYI
jgi:nucleoside-diphosphate-sugar epimerase